MKQMHKTLDERIVVVREQIQNYAMESHVHHEEFANMRKDAYAKVFLQLLDAKLNDAYEGVKSSSNLIPPAIEKKKYMLANYHRALDEMKGTTD